MFPLLMTHGGPLLMRSYLIHIYQRESRTDPRDSIEIIGIVEGIESERRYPFTNRDELWNLVTGKNPTRLAAEKISRKREG